MKNLKSIIFTENEREEFKTTTVNQIYHKIFLKKVIAGCPICPANKGCNINYKQRFRTWKYYRETQYKN